MHRAVELNGRNETFHFFITKCTYVRAQIAYHIGFGQSVLFQCDMHANLTECPPPPTVFSDLLSSGRSTHRSAVVEAMT